MSDTDNLKNQLIGTTHEPLGFPKTWPEMFSRRNCLPVNHEPPMTETPSATADVDTKTTTGAVRSADANAYDFVSMPWLGILALARTAGEGGEKYGKWNYMRGFPVDDLLNHVFRHLAMYTLGDRSEPHLGHAVWGILTAITSETLTPELSKKSMLGPGATITPEMDAYLKEIGPVLAARRKAGEFDGSGEWKFQDLPEVKTILKQREAVLSTAGQGVTA